MIIDADIHVTLSPDRPVAERVMLRSPAGPPGGLRPLWR